MPRKSLHKRLARGLYKRVSSSGQEYFLVFNGRDANGKIIWKTFPTRGEADSYLQLRRLEKGNEVAEALWSPTPEQRVRAKTAFDLLAPYGADLEEAVRHYIKTQLSHRNAPVISEIVKRLVADTQSAGRRPASVKDLRNRLGKFADRYGTRRLDTITMDELEGFLNQWRSTPRTWNNYAVKVSRLYNYAKAHRWVTENLTEHLISRPQLDTGEVEIFTPAECSKLLEHADGYGLLPYIILGLFCGIRSEELRRLDWSAVKLSEKSIVIGKDIAKKRSRRVCTLNETAIVWLAPYVRDAGKVTPPNLRHLLNKLVTKSGVKWKQNGLRHSFGSYHLSAFHDGPRTAYEMGHHDPRIVHDHYKQAVSEEAAKRFWALRPETAANVVPRRVTG